MKKATTGSLKESAFCPPFCCSAAGSLAQGGPWSLYPWRHSGMVCKRGQATSSNFRLGPNIMAGLVLGEGWSRRHPKVLPASAALCVVPRRGRELCFPLEKLPCQQLSAYRDSARINYIRKGYQSMKFLLHPEYIGIDSFSWEMCSCLALNSFTSLSTRTEHPHANVAFFPTKKVRRWREFLCRFVVTEGPGRLTAVNVLTKESDEIPFNFQSCKSVFIRWANMVGFVQSNPYFHI